MSASLTFTTVGELIKDKRTELGISISELSRRTGVSKGVIGKIENGDTKRPELKTLKPIASVLNLHFEEVIDYCIEVENRLEYQYVLLNEAITFSNFLFIEKIANKILENPSKDTYTSLEDMYEHTKTIYNREIRLVLFNTIIKYARVHGVPMYIAKGLYNKYLIEREDLKRLEESFKVGEEGLHYVDFLSDEEKVIFYFRMSLHAHNIKKYPECIELCKAGIPLAKNATELKARAYLAMINSTFEVQNYDVIEDLLNEFGGFTYDFVEESSMITRAIFKVVRREFDEAIPMLKSYIDKLSKNNKIHVVNELLEIYSELNIGDPVHEVFNREVEFLPDAPHTPYKVESLGRYYRLKGMYQINNGLHSNGLDSYIRSLIEYGKIKAHNEITECLHGIFRYFAESSRSIDLHYVKKLEEVYNEIKGKK